MRVFVTGATGFIGQVVVQELLSHGHQVLGLARSDAAAAALSKMGARVHRGDLTDIASLTAGAKESDGVIHLGFIHDFSNFANSIEVDRRAIHALIDALAGTNKPLVTTSGTATLAPGKLGLETDPASPSSPAYKRGVVENEVVAAASRGIRTAVVRLPPTVHGEGDQAFTPTLVRTAKAKGAAAYVGDGSNRWAAVHRLDAAVLYRLVLENAPPGIRAHAVAEEGIPMRAIAETIAAATKLPTKSLSPEDAPAHFDFLAMFVGIDNPTSSAATRERFGWKPTHADLFTDIRDHYATY